MSIKGITVEIGGDTSKLTKALGDVQKEGKSLSSELKKVEQLLKLDPSNTEAVAQKQKLLADSVENASKKLETLRSVQAQVEQQFKNGDLGEAEYRAFRREIEFTEASLNKLKKSQEDMKVEVEVDTKGIKEGEKALENLGDTAENTGGRASKAMGAMGVAIGAAGGAIIGLVESTKELNMDLARLEANALESGKSMNLVGKEFQQIASLSGETDSAVETMSNLLQTDFSNEQLSSVVDNISGAVIRFSDTLNSEGIADGLQETLASGKAIGQFDELLSRSGVNLDTFNAGLATAKKNGTETDYVLQQLSALGLTDTYEAYKKSNGAVLEYNEAQVALQMALAGLGERLMPLVTMVMQLGTAFVEWSNKVIDSAKAMDIFNQGISASLPQMLQNGVLMLQNFIQGITDNLPMLVETALLVVTTWLQNMATFYPMILEAGVQIITALVQGLSENIGIIVEGIAGVITALVESVVNLLPLIVSAGSDILISLVDGILELLPSLIETALNLITTIIETIVSMLPNLVESGIEILNAVIDGILEILPELIPTAVKIINQLVETITSNLPKIIDSGVKLLKSLISGITDMLPELISTALELVLTVVKTILKNLPEILSAGIKIIGSLIEGLVSAIPDIIIAIVKIVGDMIDKFQDTDWSKVGKDIIKGLISGITSMTSAAVEAISGVVGSVVDKAKSLLKTASPSRVFRDEIGKMIPLGMAEGIESHASTVENSMGRLLNIVETSQKKITDLNSRQQSQLKEIEKKAQEEKLSSLEQFIQKEYKLEKIGIQDEIALWEYASKNFKLSAEDQRQATLKLRDVKLKMYNDLKSAGDKYISDIATINNNMIAQEKALTEAYEKTVLDRTRALYSFANIFDEIQTKTETTGKQLISNLQGQVNTFRDWANNIAELGAKGIDDGLLQELRDLGPKAAAEIAALNTLTEAELKNYGDLWGEKNNLANSQAISELEDLRVETENQIDLLHHQTAVQLTELQSEWVGKMQGITNGTLDEMDILTKSMPQIGNDIISGLIKGLDSNMGHLAGKAQEIAETIENTISGVLKIQSPSLVMEKLGEWVSVGLANGIETGATSVLKATKGMIGLTIPEIDSRLVSPVGIGRTSPSQEIVIMLDSEVIGRQVVDVVGEQIVVMAGGRF